MLRLRGRLQAGAHAAELSVETSDRLILLARYSRDLGRIVCGFRLQLRDLSGELRQLRFRRRERPFDHALFGQEAGLPLFRSFRSGLSAGRRANSQLGSNRGQPSLCHRSLSFAVRVTVSRRREAGVNGTLLGLDRVATRLATFDRIATFAFQRGLLRFQLTSGRGELARTRGDSLQVVTDLGERSQIDLGVPGLLAKGAKSGVPLGSELAQLLLQ